jgi:Family of unknown function (DUF6328)
VSAQSQGRSGSGGRGGSGSGRDETEVERVDRNLQELLQELRVAIPGVQVLFAFLLVAPFNTRFADLSSGQERLYLVALMCAGAATAFLVAPTAYHRLTFRLQDKRHIVLLGNRLTVAGLAFLALAMTAAIGLVTDVVFSGVTAMACTALVAGMFALLWFVGPFRRRSRTSAKRVS